MTSHLRVSSRTATVGLTTAIIALIVAILGNLMVLVLAQSQTSANRALIERNQVTIRQLCARGHVIADVIEGGIAVVTAERNDPNVPAATHVADDKFIAQFNADLDQIQREFASPQSLCYGDSAAR